MGAPRERGGPPEQLAEREVAFRIDQDLSYLGLRCLTCGEAPEKPVARDGMSYIEARAIWHPYLTVERFSLLLRMRDLFRERRASTGRLAASIGITELHATTELKLDDMLAAGDATPYQAGGGG